MYLYYATKLAILPLITYHSTSESRQANNTVDIRQTLRLSTKQVHPQASFQKPLLTQSLQLKTDSKSYCINDIQTLFIIRWSLKLFSVS